MHQKLFATVMITLFVSASFAATKQNGRSPNELINCLTAKDRVGLAETLKYVSINTRFTPSGNTVLMEAVDLYAKRLTQRSPVEFAVGKAIISLAGLSGCVAGYKVSPPVEKKEIQPQPQQPPQRPAQPIVQAPRANLPRPQPIDEEHAGGYNPFGFAEPFVRSASHAVEEGVVDAREAMQDAREAMQDVRQVVGHVDRILEEWDQGIIKVEPAGKISEETAQAIQDAVRSVEKTNRDAQYYMRTSAIIGCAAISLWAGIKTLQQLWVMRQYTRRHEEDLEMFEAIIDQLLNDPDLDFTVKNDAGEAVVDLMRRIVITYGSGDEEFIRLLKLERKILHAARNIKV